MTATAARPDLAPLPPPTRLTSTQLLRGLGGGRYAVATVVSSLGGGLIRPFLLLYAVTVSHLSASAAGLALSVGFLVGLTMVPVAGRWVDRGGCRAVMVSTLFLRGCGLLALLMVPGPAGFVICCVLQGIGNQSGPIGQAAVVASFAAGHDRDAVLATLRSLANGGLGVGALAATVIVSAGGGGVRWLAAGTAAGYLIAAGLVAGVPINDPVPSASSAPTVDPVPPVAGRSKAMPTDQAVLRRLALMNVANLPFAFCFDVLEVALPVVLVLQVHAAAGWSSGIFLANTIMVVLVQLPVVLWLARYPRRRSFALAGWVLASSYLGFLLAGAGHGTGAAVAIALVSLLYNLGEMMYTGVGTALVVDAAPPRLRGRALARWQLSLGLGRAVAPLTITAALAVTAATLWLPLAALTILGAGLISRYAPRDAGADSSPEAGGRRAVRQRRACARALAERDLQRSGYWQDLDRLRWQTRGPRPFR